MNRTRIVASLFAVFVILTGLSAMGTLGPLGCFLPASNCTKVLFIGNSYTYTNDLPSVFANLAWSGGHRVSPSSLTEGGQTLAGHLQDPATRAALLQSPATVVLQDQSEDPALASSQRSEMFPATTGLVQEIRASGASPLLFQTWAHQNGWPEAYLPTYTAMQAAIDQGYQSIGQTLNVPIAPVGDAWQAVLQQQGAPALWLPDGSHPTVAGTYLAGCVLYIAIYRVSPVGLGYHDGLPDSTATLLQNAAAH